MATQLFLLKVEHYCALEGLIVLLILMFKVAVKAAVLCSRVPATCQALVLTSHLPNHLFSHLPAT